MTNRHFLGHVVEHVLSHLTLSKEPQSNQNGICGNTGIGGVNDIDNLALFMFQ